MSVAEQGRDLPPQKERPEGISTGLYFPAKVLTTDEIGSWGVMLPSGRVLTTENIASKIGVERRHIAKDNETVADMGFRAADAAIGMDTGIDLILTSSSHPTPYNISSEIGRMLGISGADVMDVHAACSGSALGFAYLHEHREELDGKKVLLVATERLSDTVIDLRREDAMDRDPSLAQTILGDGAAAISFTFGRDFKTYFAMNRELPASDGSTDLITMAIGRKPFIKPYIGHPVACKEQTNEFPMGYFAQEGQAVYKGVQENIPPTIRTAVEQAGFTPKDIDLVVFHPGSKAMADALTRRLSEFRVHSVYADANMSSVSMLHSLNDAIEKGMVGKGSKIVLSGFGAGSPHLFSSTVVAELG